jgi:hypothetical protein
MVRYSEEKLNFFILISKRIVRIFIIGSMVPFLMTGTENSNPFCAKVKNISPPR